MPPRVNCTACGRSMDVNLVIAVGQKYYCDKFCLYVDDPTSPYISVPQDKREAFNRLANAKAMIRSAEASAAELQASN